jgi:hypothetical protein
LDSALKTSFQIGVNIKLRIPVIVTGISGIVTADSVLS